MSRSNAISFGSLTLSLAILAAACGVYSFTGGGGLPGHIRTIAIAPFDNETTQFTLTQELTQALLDDFPSRLGLRPAGENTADAILRGRITRYQESATNFQADPEGPVIFQRRVTVAISAELYDARQDRVLWQASSLSAEGEYLPESQTELEGRQLAIENLVQKVIDGAQSQW